LPKLPDGVARSETNTPWGFSIPGRPKYYGLHRQNLRFFLIVGVWYAVSVALICFSVHALASTLERTTLNQPPPNDASRRRHWWALRVWPLLISLGSVGTELSRGQVDVVVLGAISLGIYLMAASRDVSAGCCFVVPAAIKLFPPFLLLYPLWRARGRMLAGVLAGLVLLLAVLPAVTLGPSRTVALYGSWIHVLAGPALGHGTDTSRTHELTGMTSTDNQSLLAFIHNWRYWRIPRKQRPPAAMPGERYAVYGVGIALLLAIAVAAKWRRRDQPRELLLVVGLLISLSFVISPIVHNYYYLGLLPLIAGLLDYGLAVLCRFWPGPAAIGARTSRPRVSWQSRKSPRGRGVRAPFLNAHGNRTLRGKKVLCGLALFAIVDFLARLPGIGPALRDRGAPLLSVLVLMGTAVYLLLRPETHAPATSPSRETA
jgi:hypothetical protein